MNSEAWKMQRYSWGEWRGLIAPEFQAQVMQWENLERWMASQQVETVVDKATRRVFRVTTPAGVVYVKRVSTLADGTGGFKDLLRKIKWFCRSSRMLRVAQIHCHLHNAGLGCPKPLAALRRKQGWLSLPEEVLITAELPVPSLTGQLREAPLEEQRQLVTQVTAGIVELHRQGFVHGDLIPGNILWDGKRCHFIDNDRTVWTGMHLIRRRMQRRNLAKFAFHLTQVTRDFQLGRFFLEEYNRQAPSAGLPTCCVDTMFKALRQRMKENIPIYGWDIQLPPEE